MRGRRPSCFVALRVCETAVVNGLCAAQQRVIPAAHAAQSIKPARFHITMALAYADTAEEQRTVMDAVGPLLCGGWEPFSLTLRGLGQFGNGKVVFASVADGVDALAELAGRLRAALEPTGLLHVDAGRAAGHFAPHCTLWKSRSRDRVAVPEADATLFGTVRVGHLELVRMDGGDAGDGFYASLGPQPLVLLSDLALAEREQVLDRVFELEAASFPPDEAATRAKLALRIAQAPELFLIARVNGTVVAFVNGTAAPSAEGLTHDTMDRHDPLGDLVCIHGVVVDASLRRRGWGARLLRYYVRTVVRSRFALLCKLGLVPFYESCGFVNSGPSTVVHGADQWFDLHLTRADHP